MVSGTQTRGRDDGQHNVRGVVLEEVGRMVFATLKSLLSECVRVGQL